VTTSSATTPKVETTAHALQLPHGCTFARRNGDDLPVEGSMAPIHDRNGHPTGTVLVFRDVSAARAMTLQITHSAHHDSLTGLPNRAHLTERISTAISFARRHSSRVALLFLDLDGFKHINDSLGHSFGDKLLQSVADRIVYCARTTDTVSRQGGDEFVVLLAEVAVPEDASVVAHRILASVARPHTIDEHELHVGASIGVSMFPDDGIDAETLIKNADTAMYQAKANGRQSVQYFTPAMNARAVERQWIEAGLRRALERDELALAYQPKINVRSRRITGAEALLRWTHPVRGPISPAQFIPIAEDTGLIRQIGAWVMRRACAQAKAWADAGLALSTMAVNVSSMEFRDDSFLDGLFTILDDTGLPAHALELELTESVLMKHVETAAVTLGTLRDQGVQIAIDDFGTGYSSLSYLRKFPIDALKIDQSFVAGIANAADDASIVTAVIGMARSLNLRVVAEGVETREQAKFLQVHECDEAQGYYFSKPVTAEQFARLAETLPGPN
jgi:diguanylate cyclase (GGDEF)-like protein